MNKTIHAVDGTEILVGDSDIITCEKNGQRVSSGARAFRREELGDWVSIDLMEYDINETGTTGYLSVNVSPEHAREFALAILRELDREFN